MKNNVVAARESDDEKRKRRNGGGGEQRKEIDNIYIGNCLGLYLVLRHTNIHACRGLAVDSALFFTPARHFFLTSPPAKKAVTILPSRSVMIARVRSSTTIIMNHETRPYIFYDIISVRR